MNFLPTKPILRVTHGSHLYGTSTPESDYDFKGVHIPSGREILLQQAENVIDGGIKLSTSIKNQAGDIDDQSFSVQKYLQMLSVGDTVATEMLFASRKPEMITSDFDPIWTNRHKILNKQCKGFVGYCVRQAAKYGIKGSRMNSVKAILDYLEIAKLGRPLATARLSDIEEGLRKWSEGREHVKWENIPSQHGKDIWHLDVCDRKMPLTVRIEDAYHVWAKVWENYGDRARQAADNEGVDWKAMSHAVRVAKQAIELLTTGEIIFPRPEAEALLFIKKGEWKYDAVSGLLEDLVAELKETKSDLPEKSDQELINNLVLYYHWGQL